jgi:hypothetical protein
MVRYYFEEKPKTITIGSTLRGKRYIFVNLDVKEITGNILDSDGIQYKYDCYNMRFVLSELSVACLVANMPKEFIVLATEDEIKEIIQAFKADDDIESWKSIRTAQIEAYDSSPYVNNFKLNGVNAWLDKSTRVGLVNMLQSDWGDTPIPDLWLDSEHPISLPNAEIGLTLLSEIEKYAAQCYSVTQRLLASVKNIAKLKSFDDLRNFDYKSEYPEQLDLTV